MESAKEKREDAGKKGRFWGDRSWKRTITFSYGPAEETAQEMKFFLQNTTKEQKGPGTFPLKSRISHGILQDKEKTPACAFGIEGEGKGV